MNEKLDKELCEKFPLLYADRNAPMNQTAMCWGFDVGDGWFKIIYNLSEKLEKIIEEMKASGVDEDSLPRVAQVKEKFGGLRFYMFGYTDEIDEAIEEAAKQCWETCEQCGDPGELRDDIGWIRTLCKVCYLATISEA